MIRLEHVTKVYDSNPAVTDFSLEVNKGEVCVLIGPSGCGKTTVLRMINRLIEPTSGRILVNGEDISKTRPEQLRRSIGYAIQSVGLFPHMTVADNIAFGPKIKTLPKAEAGFERYGSPTVFSARFVALLRIVAAFMAGVAEMRWRTFLFWNAAGGIAWALVVGLGAYELERRVVKVYAEYGRYAGIAAAALVICAAVLVHLWRRRHRRRAAR